MPYLFNLPLVKPSWKFPHADIVVVYFENLPLIGQWALCFVTEPLAITPKILQDHSFSYTNVIPSRRSEYSSTRNEKRHSVYCLLITHKAFSEVPNFQAPSYTQFRTHFQGYLAFYVTDVSPYLCCYVQAVYISNKWMYTKVTQILMAHNLTDNISKKPTLCTFTWNEVNWKPQTTVVAALQFVCCMHMQLSHPLPSYLFLSEAAGIRTVGMWISTIITDSALIAWYSQNVLDIFPKVVGLTACQTSFLCAWFYSFI